MTMTDERFQSTPEDVFAGRAVPPEMLQDFLLIAQLDKGVCNLIAQSLQTMSGIPDVGRIESAVREAGVPDTDVAGIARALRGVNQSKLQKYLEAVDGWIAGRSERAKLFTPDVIQSLSENLSILVDKHPIELMQKAEQLLRDVGNEIEDVKFVCDLRPVFDDARENVEAYVSIATMRLIYQQQDGNRKVCEIALTEDELKTLGELTEVAIKKMEVLNKLRPTLVVQCIQGDEE